MGFEDLMRSSGFGRKPGEGTVLRPGASGVEPQAAGLPMRTHLAAAISGIGQGMMDKDFAARYNAGGSGYYDIYRAQQIKAGMENMGARERVNALKKKYGQVLGMPGLENLERGQSNPQGGEF